MTTSVHESPMRIADRLIAAALLVTYFATLGAPYVAHAQDSSGTHAPARRGTGARDSVSSGGSSSEAALGEPSGRPGAAADTREIGIPGAQGATGVSAQSISLPSAEGSVEGMGESFSPILSAGTASYGVPIRIAPGRGGIQPSFALSYSSSGGNGVVGLGWGFGAPRISRQLDKGTPRYVDRAAWHREEDRFVGAGAGELVPVDATRMAAVDASGLGYATGHRPSDVGASWQEYRARVEGGFQRIFRAPDFSRWVVLSKDGSRADYGALPTGDGPSDLPSSLALQSDAAGSGRTYAWFLTRQSDAHGSTIYYRYAHDRNEVYLVDAYYVSPAACADAGDAAARRACSEPLASYGARVHFDYGCASSADPAACRSDHFVSHAVGFRVETAWRLSRITITAFDDVLGQRALVRRYHLTYVQSRYHSLLESLMVEGRPEALDASAGVNVFQRVAESSLGNEVVGMTTPPMLFGYSSMPTNGPQAVGFGGIDTTLRSVIASPNVSLDAARTGLFDVNGDGLVDVLVTDPSRYRTRDGQPAAGVFFNGFRGAGAEPASAGATFSEPIPVPMDPTYSNVMNLDSLVVVPMDVDGDGRGDLMHLPRLAEYGWFTPARTNTTPVVSPADQGWRFAYGRVRLPAGQTDPRIDLLRDSTQYRAFDVNGDHLVDVVRTTGTSMETWLNLGWLPGGEGRFGQATPSGTSWTFSNEPIVTCLLNDGSPLSFGDSTIRLGDFDGDGTQDIARLQRGRFVYWPGRGGAAWGEGSTSCSIGQGANRHVAFVSPPAELDSNLNGVSLADVDHDGLDDVVQVRFREVDVWFNRGGQSFTPRITVASPIAADFQSRVQMADIDGSGTMDLVYGSAGQWKYLDLTGGVRPRILTSVQNGLGASSRIAYESSTIDYLRDLRGAAEAAACDQDNCDSFRWEHFENAQCDALLQAHDPTSGCYFRSGHSPVISSVVRRVETSDNFDLVGRERNTLVSEFAYHDGYYDGLEQEFRGFAVADSRNLGDSFGPTAITRSWFLQARRPNAIAVDRSADNPYEALKGRLAMAETFDEAGSYLGTTHATFGIRRLIEGLDGRAVSYAYVRTSDSISYDTSHAPTPGPTLVLDAFVPETVGSGGSIPSAGASMQTHALQLRSDDYVWRRNTTDLVDNVGNVLRSTAHGNLHGEGAPPSTQPSEQQSTWIVSHSEPLLLADSCGAAGAWSWRSRSSYVTDGFDGPHFQEGTSTFDCEGNLLKSEASARYDDAIPDFGALGDMSASETLIGSIRYDAWGQSLASCTGADLLASGGAAACLRYSEVERDVAFDQIVTRESTAVDTSTNAYCSRTSPQCMVDTTAIWDRGTGAVLSATDPNAQISTVGYDGFGRLVFVRPPNVDGCLTTTPTSVIRYSIRPQGLPVNVVETTIDPRDATCAHANPTVIRAYSDGLGRVRVSLVQGDTNGTWIKSGSHRLGAHGQATCGVTNAAVYGASPSVVEALAHPSLPAVCGTTDAFGRMVEAVDYRDPAIPRSQTIYHAASIESWDPLDLGIGLDGRNHLADTPSYVRYDGHGRVVEQVEQLRRPGETQKQFLRTIQEYRVDGVVTLLGRAETDSADPDTYSVVDDHLTYRTFWIDSLGRRMGGYDPDSWNAADGESETSGWRYRYNGAGDLAAVRDPRGCGQDFFYDRAGRLIGERYVTCDEAQDSGEIVAETVPIGSLGIDVLSTPVGVHVRNYFDALPSWESDLSNATTERPSDGHWIGRATGSIDRGQRSLAAYDARGLPVWSARQMAILPEEAGNVPSSWTSGSGTFAGELIAAVTRSFDTAHTYTVTASYDHLGRPRGMKLPEDPDGAYYGGGTGAPTIQGRLTYNRRGLTNSVVADVGGTDWTILSSASYDVDGLPKTMSWGSGIQETFSYDALLRPTRHAVALHVGPTPTLPLDVATGVYSPVDDRYTWDVAGNLTMVTDMASPAALPSGHRQSRQRVQHDSLYRVSSVDYDYRQNTTGSTPLWGPSDAMTDWRDERSRATTEGPDHLSTDPMHREPAPMLPDDPDARVGNLTYDYDWLANTTEWTDDANAFFERSLGRIESGRFFEGTRPSALYFATNLPDVAPAVADPMVDRGGFVEVDYGVSGNVVGFTARARCHDRVVDESTSLLCYVDPSAYPAPGDQATFARENCECAAAQHYEYRWDELNRLVEARRYDLEAGTFVHKAWQRYRYDAGNVRTVKQTIDLDPVDPDLHERIHLAVTPGQFERVGVRLDRTLARYVSDAALGSETQFRVAGARMVYRAGSPAASGYDDDHRITMGFANLIGSTSAVVDLISNELVELSTYYPNGQRETHLTSTERPAAIEPNGFTGKEADEEIGLIYFGERYLIAQLGRWATPDPLAIHAAGGGEILNSYHYVSGNIFQSRDPNGLDAEMNDWRGHARTELGESIGPNGSLQIPIGPVAPQAELPPSETPSLTPPEASSPPSAPSVEAPAPAPAVDAPSPSVPGPRPNRPERTYLDSFGDGFSEAASNAWGALQQISISDVASDIGDSIRGTLYDMVFPCDLDRLRARQAENRRRRDAIWNTARRFLNANGHDRARMLGHGTFNSVVVVGTVVVTRGVGGLAGRLMAAEAVGTEAVVVAEAASVASLEEGGGLVALDANAFRNLNTLRGTGVLSPGDTVIVSPNVATELARHGISATHITEAGVGIAAESPIGASVAATRIGDVLRGLGGRGAASASADALNLAEATGLGANTFVTADRQVLSAFRGMSIMPGTNGLSITVVGF